MTPKKAVEELAQAIKNLEAERTARLKRLLPARKKELAAVNQALEEFTEEFQGLLDRESLFPDEVSVSTPLNQTYVTLVWGDRELMFDAHSDGIWFGPTGTRGRPLSRMPREKIEAATIRHVTEWIETLLRV